jgi:hypothetical protein
MCSVDLNIGTTSGTKHIRTIFSIWTGTDKHFIGNALCSSDDSDTQLIHILLFFIINNIFYRSSEEKIQRSQENEGARMTGDTLLSVMENSALCHVPVRTVFQFDHFSSRVRAFLEREFPDRGIRRGGAFPGHPFLQT